MLSVWLLLPAHNGNTFYRLTDGRKMLAESSFLPASELFLKYASCSFLHREVSAQRKFGNLVAVVCRQPASSLGVLQNQTRSGIWAGFKHMLSASSVLWAVKLCFQKVLDLLVICNILLCKHSQVWHLGKTATVHVHISYAVYVTEKDDIIGLLLLFCIGLDIPELSELIWILVFNSLPI